jgi:hypothetical protein
MKKIAFYLTLAFMLIPAPIANAFAGGPHMDPFFDTASLGNSIGTAVWIAFTTAIFFTVFTPIFFILPIAFIIGYFIHRKYVAYFFMGLYAIFSGIIIIADNFSDKSLYHVREFAILFFWILFATIVSFFSSTYANKHRKHKLKFSKKDYRPLLVIIIITFIFMILPIRAGHFFCKKPLIHKPWICNYYLQERADDLGWFTH